MQSFNFGPLSIDPVEFASQGNAILGIRDSGKTYSATKLGECLFDAGIPWFAFDPIGVWRWLRVPGAGRGYPVVVAGGKAPDLPLTVDGTPDLVRQAMAAGVSVIFDLFDLHLSKADWRKIVTAAVRTMLHENHDLRHVFIEEAAEFIPQRPHDFIVYAELEKLARMGRNSRLGYTLINQRSQEVSKAILELCENVFLHRQRGSHAIQALDKWLQVAEATERRRIVKSLPDLPRGECWAWLGGDVPQPPHLIKVPQKNSLHPDARAMRGDAAVPRAKPVDVAEFVARMKGRPAPATTTAKPKETDVTKEEADRLRAENDELRLEINRLKAGLAPRPVIETKVASISPAPGATPIEANMDNERLYQAIKERLAKEAPGLLKVLAIKPEIEVTHTRPVIKTDTEKQPGLIASMIADGYFGQPVTAATVVNELKRRGRSVHHTNVYRDLNRLAEQGFLTIETTGYQAVEGMKVNIVEGA